MDSNTFHFRMRETGCSRRGFLAAAVGAAAAAVSPARELGAQQAEAGASVQLPPIAVFIKHIQPLGTEEIARRIGSQPVDGIEATLRKGGLIEPQELAAELPRLVDALAQYDRSILIAASDINHVDRRAEDYVRQLARSGIPYMRMSYYRYALGEPLLPQLDRFAQQASELAELAAAEGVTALYQNHAGTNYVGAALWDLLHVLDGIDPEHLGVAVDVRHAGVELTQSYRAACSVIEAYRRAVYVKDFRWDEANARNVPLGEGFAKPVFDFVARRGLSCPVSLHMEYTDHRDPTQVETSWQAICNDIITLRQWLTEQPGK